MSDLGRVIKGSGRFRVPSYLSPIINNYDFYSLITSSGFSVCPRPNSPGLLLLTVDT
jgi:hypothetical protein